MKVKNKAELQKAMDHYGLKKIPVWGHPVKKPVFYGLIVRTNDGLQYTHEFCPYWPSQDVAIVQACKQFKDTEEVVKMLAEEGSAIAIEHVSDPYGDRRSKETGYTWKGTWKEIFTKMEENNRHVRYCNGHYWYFKSKKNEHRFAIWKRIISEAESMKNYYGNATVD